MKNNKKIGIIALVALAAIGSYFIAGTYAKYTSEISGTGTATVAKWKWTINSDVIDSSAKATAGYTFDLFKTIKDSDGTSTETDVAEGLIAPGTSGSFDIEITNNSEVNATYAIAFTETNANNIPIEYSTDGNTWGSDISSLDVSNTTINVGATANTKTIYWRWAYYKNATFDATDTNLGFGANTNPATVQVTAKITVTQVD